MDISNVTFDELTIGQQANLSRSLTEEDIELFAVVSGDVNPAHLDKDYAKNSLFHSIIGHGFWSGSLLSTLLGTELPGPGTIYLSQNMRFLAPVKVGDQVTARVTCIEKIHDKQHAIFQCEVHNADGQHILSGEAKVLVPVEKVRLERPNLPLVTLHRRQQFKRLKEQCRQLAPAKAAVVHPVTPLSLSGAVQSCKEGLITPVLIGPAEKIRAAAELAEVDLSPYELIDVPHSHAAAEKAVAMARDKQVDMLMKGNLGTQELLSAVLRKDSGLRRERRMSHCYILFTEGRKNPMLVTDAALNIAPNLMEKADICQNAIELALSLGITEPKVAALAGVEKINPSMQATIDAACLAKMSQRGQITGGWVDGPMAFDIAVSITAAFEKGIQSDVAGKADIFLVPNLEAGNMLAKQLIFQGNAEAAGVILGAGVPIVLTSRSDSVETRVASATVARLHAENGKKLSKIAL
ncbi:MAG: bifunctional enoyl-CoA hydratase/phosphate acetyltransferase [Pseudomonadales bacterium]